MLLLCTIVQLCYCYCCGWSELLLPVVQVAKLLVKNQLDIAVNNTNMMKMMMMMVIQL